MNERLKVYNDHAIEMYLMQNGSALGLADLDPDYENQEFKKILDSDIALQSYTIEQNANETETEVDGEELGLVKGDGRSDIKLSFPVAGSPAKMSSA